MTGPHILGAVEIRLDEHGLVPVVIQDWNTGEVLTLAYANAEAVERKCATGEPYSWSRSRDELWHKGATSGKFQAGPSAWTATATHRRARRARGPGPPHWRADVLPPRRCPAGDQRRRTRRCPSSKRTLCSCQAGAGLRAAHRRAPGRPAAHRREGHGGGRGGTARAAREEDRRPRRQRGGRRPVSPARPPARARPGAWPTWRRSSMAVAAEPSFTSRPRSTRCASSPASTTSSPCGHLSSTTSRRRSPPSSSSAGVHAESAARSCSSPSSAASGSGATRSSAPAAERSSA